MLANRWTCGPPTWDEEDNRRSRRFLDEMHHLSLQLNQALIVTCAAVHCVLCSAPWSHSRSLDHTTPTLHVPEGFRPSMNPQNILTKHKIVFMFIPVRLISLKRCPARRPSDRSRHYTLLVPHASV